MVSRAFKQKINIFIAYLIEHVHIKLSIIYIFIYILK